MSNGHILHEYRPEQLSAVLPNDEKKPYIKPKGSKVWRDHEKRLLHKLYPCVRTRCIAALLGRTSVAIKNKSRDLNIDKLPPQEGDTFIWQHPLPGIYRRFIRVDNRLIPYNQYRYIQQNGPIPPGFILIFKDGDRMNDHPDNMQLTTRVDALNNVRAKRTEAMQRKRKARRTLMEMLY